MCCRHVLDMLSSYIAIYDTIVGYQRSENATGSLITTCVEAHHRFDCVRPALFMTRSVYWWQLLDSYSKSVMESLRSLSIPHAGLLDLALRRIYLRRGDGLKCHFNVPGQVSPKLYPFAELSALTF